MVFPVCMIRNMGRFISERVEGRKGGRGITENPCFPQEGQCWGTTCLGQENWQGTERVLRERAEEVAGGRGCKKQPGLTRRFSCYRDKEEWKKVFSKQLLWNEFAGSVLNLKWSNMLWMGSFHQNVTKQEAGKKTQVFDKLWYQTSSVSLARSYTAISRSCDIWAASKSTTAHGPCDAVRCSLFSKRSEFLTLAVEEAQLI